MIGKAGLAANLREMDTVEHSVCELHENEVVT